MTPSSPDEPADENHRRRATTEAARNVLTANSRTAGERSYTIPTAGLYPFQWNWDSAFTALGLATIDLDRAWREVESLVAAQWPSGMIPHIVFWTDEASYFPGADVWRGTNTPPSSGISQPPVLATVIRSLLDADDSPTRREQAARLLPALDAWHRWWHTARDPGKRGIIAVAHPWESGRDNLPDWDTPLAAVDTGLVAAYQRRDTHLVDPAQRPHDHEYDRYLALVQFGADCRWDDATVTAASPFLVADPAVTAILARSEGDLAHLASALNPPLAAAAESRAADLVQGYEQFWNPAVGAYCSLDLRSGHHAQAATSASFLAPYGGVTERLEQVVEELAAWSEHCTYLVPSFDPRHPGFEPNRYWRGPIWAVVNHMISVGLAEHDVSAEWGQRVRRSTGELILNTGFSESFNPISGSGTGGTDFSWTAALWLAWCEQP